MITKILYYFRCFSFDLFLFLCTINLPYIFKMNNWIGILFLVCIILYTITILFTHLSKKWYYETTLNYNLTIIFLTVYYSFISVILYYRQNNLDITYVLQERYFKLNFLFLSFIILGIIINTFLLYSYYNGIEEKKISL